MAKAAHVGSLSDNGERMDRVDAVDLAEPVIIGWLCRSPQDEIGTAFLIDRRRDGPSR